MRLLNNRGSEWDLFYTSVMVIVAAIVIVFAYFINAEITTQFAAQGIDTEALGHAANALKTFNLSIVFITVAFGVATFIAAFMVRSHPIFFVGSVLGLIVMLMVLTIMANTYDKLMIDSVFRTTATGTFSIMFNWVRNLPRIFVALWLVMAVGLYAKGKLEI